MSYQHERNTRRHIRRLFTHRTRGAITLMWLIFIFIECGLSYLLTLDSNFVLGFQAIDPTMLEILTMWRPADTNPVVFVFILMGILLVRMARIALWRPVRAAVLEDEPMHSPRKVLGLTLPQVFNVLAFQALEIVLTIAVIGVVVLTKQQWVFRLTILIGMILTTQLYFTVGRDLRLREGVAHGFRAIKRHARSLLGVYLSVFALALLIQEIMPSPDPQEPLHLMRVFSIYIAFEFFRWRAITTRLLSVDRLEAELEG